MLLGNNSNTYFVASGFGKQSDWYQNILKTPTVSIQVGRQRMDVMTHPMRPEESGEAMISYARRYPKAAKVICRQVGYRVDGSEADYRTVEREAIPFVSLYPLEN